MTEAVLLMAYGTPSSPDEIEAYYTDIRRGRPPTAEHGGGTGGFEHAGVGDAQLAQQAHHDGGPGPLGPVSDLEGAGPAVGQRERVHGQGRCRGRARVRPSPPPPPRPTG